MKERVTITLESDILRQLDNMVDGFQVKNRSHAIELLVSKSLNQEIPGAALIMAAGRTKKVKVGSKQYPVKMAPINEKPVLEHLIKLFVKYGIKKIFIAICYDKDQVRDHFGDGSRYGANIYYLEEKEPSGTTNLLRKMRHYINGPLFVTNADELKDLNLADMYRFHVENKALATIALTTVADPSRYGMVNLEGNKIRSFTEKPRGDDQSKIINSGLYLFNPEILTHIPHGSKMLYDFLPGLARQDQLFGYFFDGQWYDVSGQKRYDDARKSWEDIS